MNGRKAEVLQFALTFLSHWQGFQNQLWYQIHLYIKAVGDKLLA
jgi:hypothetical protein